MKATTSGRRLVSATARLGCVLPVLLAASVTAAHAQSNVQQLADRWTQAYNRHDSAELGGLYTEDARLVVHGSPTVTGRSNITGFWAADFQEGNPLTLLTVTDAVTGSDMRLVHGDYEVVDRDDGARLGEGRFAHIWVRDGGREWRLDRDLWNQPFLPYDETNADVDVQGLADRWVEAYNGHDGETLASLYARDARLMMHGAPSYAGRREIADFWAEDFEAGNPLTLLTVTHSVDGVDMTLVHGNYEVVDREDGVVVGLGRFAHIWFQDEDGNWRLDRDLWLERSVPFEY